MAEKEEKPSEKAEGKGAGRWWEFYFVRYALGTVLGVVVIIALVKSGIAIPFPDDEVSDLTEPERLPLLAIYGLAYCYLASAPILVFHAARFAMGKRLGRPFFLKLGTSLVIFAAWFVYARWTGYILEPSEVVVAGLSLFCFVYLVVSQVLALFHGMYETDKMWRFYWELDQRRRIPGNRELLDSYRHLREHGNAFFIVFLELLLGMSLYAAGKISFFPPGYLNPKPCDSVSKVCLDLGVVQTVSVLAVWVLPAACVWAIGCYFEAKFAESSPSPGTSTTAVSTGQPASSPSSAAPGTASHP